jgi:hypothetical protein
MFGERHSQKISSLKPLEEEKQPSHRKEAGSSTVIIDLSQD